MLFDGKVIFSGELRKAPGDLSDPAAACEVILFTDDGDILSVSVMWLHEGGGVFNLCSCCRSFLSTAAAAMQAVEANDTYSGEFEGGGQLSSDAQSGVEFASRRLQVR